MMWWRRAFVKCPRRRSARARFGTPSGLVLEQALERRPHARSLRGRGHFHEELLETRMRDAALDERPTLRAQNLASQLARLARVERAVQQERQVRQIALDLLLQETVDGRHELDELV